MCLVAIWIGLNRIHFSGKMFVQDAVACINPNQHVSLKTQMNHVHAMMRKIRNKKEKKNVFFFTYSRSVSNGIFLGTCCKSLCEQSTVCPVHVQTRGHFWSIALLPTFVLAKLVPWMKMPTLPTLLLCDPNGVSPLPYGISCTININIPMVAAFTTRRIGGLFFFDIISHIWLSPHRLTFDTTTKNYLIVIELIGNWQSINE